MSKVRIGFVGVGGMGQMAHLRNYVTIDDCEVVAIAEVRRKTGELVAQRYGVPKVYTDHNEMLRSEKLDGVVAVQPFQRHIELIPQLMGKAKCLLTEKPVAVSVEDGMKIAAAAKKTGTIHMVGYHKRSDPATMYARKVMNEWIASGAMGKLKYVRVIMPSGDWVANGFIGLLNAGDVGPPCDWNQPVPGMDAETAKRYVGFVNYYIHQVNLMRHLLGEDYKVAYADKTGVLLAVQGESGTPGVIEMTPYRTTVDWEESALIAFEKGYINLRLPAPLATDRCGTVEVFTDPGDAQPVRSFPTMPWVHAMRQQAVNFVKVCKGEIAPLCDGAEAVKDLEVARQYINLMQ